MGDASSTSFRSQPTAVFGWAAAGMPILASGTQAVARAVGTPVEFWPVVGGVSESLKQVTAFQRLALAFDPESPLVLALFVLVVTAWLTLGLSLFRPAPIFQDYARLVRGGGLFASTVLYGLLFAGGYWSVLTDDPTVAETVALVGLPAVVFGGIYVAAKVQPRTTGNRLLNEASRRLDAIEQEIDETVERLVAQTDRLDPDVDDFEAASDSVKTYKRRIGRIESDIKETRSLPENQRALRARELLREEVEPLESAATTAEVESAVRDRLATWLADTYGTVTVESSVGRPYTLENHRDYRHVEIDAAPLPASVPVTQLDDLAASIRAESVGIEATVRVVNTVDAHVQALREDLSERDAAFTSAAEDVRAELETAFNRIDEFPGSVGKYVTGAYGRGAVDGVAHAGVVSMEYGPDSEPGELDRAVEFHHDCRFEKATRTVEEAWEKARRLTQVVGFVKRVVLTTDDGLPGMDLPEWSSRTNPFFSRALLERGINARLDGVRLDPNWETGRIDYQYQGSRDEQTTTDEDDEDGQSDYLVDDGVRWLFNALEGERVGSVHSRPGGDADGPSNRGIEIHRGNLPQSKRDPAVMEAAADHVANQTVLDATVDRDRLPGTLAFEVEPTGGGAGDDRDGTGPLTQTQIGAALLDSFQTQLQQS